MLPPGGAAGSGWPSMPGGDFGMKKTGAWPGRRSGMNALGTTNVWSASVVLKMTFTDPVAENSEPMLGSPMPTPLDTRMLPATPGMAPPSVLVEIISRPVTEPYSRRADPDPNDNEPVRNLSLIHI